MKKVELLAPLKNFKSLNAVLGNADSVYFGLEGLNMRMFSDNFKQGDLGRLCKTCHDNGIKTYLTTNVIMYENEFDILNKILDQAVETEVDGIIVHDIGAIELIKEKGLKFHVSTQASISNSKSVY
jgi:putative protease